jgi:hypothetical protein
MPQIPEEWVERRKDDDDVIIVGAEHNGLTEAAYLQRAGLDVIVLEASPTSCGMPGTNPNFPCAPDHLVNGGGIQASLFRSATIEDDLEPKCDGRRQIIADPFNVRLDANGPSLAFWRDPAKTAEEIRHFSQRDARKYLVLPAAGRGDAVGAVRARGTHPTGGISGIPAHQFALWLLKKKHGQEACWAAPSGRSRIPTKEDAWH